jgi:hypothetical protein
LSKEKLTNVTLSLIDLSPIVLFVYNRPEHTKRTIESLLKNPLAEKSTLYIFSDGPKSDSDEKSVCAVRNYIQALKGFNKIEIIERDKNLGLANSVIIGVDEIFRNYYKVIVMEDDMLSSPYFLKFMNDLLIMFENNRSIYSVTGYTFPIKIPDDYTHPLYLAPRASSWGWGTWKDRWEKVDWEMSDYRSFIKDKATIREFNKGGDDLTRMLTNSISGKIDSWAVKWCYAHFKNKAYCVYPVTSRIKNIGADRSGVHTNRTKKFDVELELNDINLSEINDLQPDDTVLLNFRKFFKKNVLSSLIQRINN